MKKLVTLLFAFVVLFSLTMPVFAQEAAGGETTKTEKSKKSKATKAKKAKKSATTAPTS
jgi:hypothetical protein